VGLITSRRRAVPLSGKVAVITGAARGIGRATAVALAAKGMRVVIADLDLDLAEKAAREINGDAIALELDVTDRHSLVEFLDHVEREVGPLDVLINNAGIMPTSLIADEDDASTTRQIAINLHGVIAGTREAVRRMQPRGTGHIINIASVGGKIAAARAATYTATKYGVVGFSEAVALELAGTGVEISVIYPPATDTTLLSGVKQVGLPRVKPQAIAEAIVDVLERPRFNRTGPGAIGIALSINQAMPHRLRLALARATGMDTVLDNVDPVARQEYEARVGRAVAANRHPESETATELP
jgi:NAD(P)-dependent dehydrogenase (short-subunit alcohol dehydrogenase family)